jgi:cytoskeletal protein CcmA (bactofilin family)
MAQIIKHRRGSIDSLVSATAKKGELIMATGSVGNMNGPWIFVGETEGSAGAFRGISKIYQGAAAPDLTVGTWGSTLNGTPFHASNDDTLYILSNSGNVAIDLTGNIEGNTIDSLTINNLEGNLNLNGDLLMTGNTYQTGSITLTGDVTLRGNINIGDNLTGDTININGEISSSLIPSDNNAFDLGSIDNAWKDLYVSGTAYIENLSLAGISVNSISLPGDLTVSGTTILSGSVFVEDLTNDRIVLAGVDGQLEDDANFTFDGTTFKIGQGETEMDQATGNIRTSGSLTVKGETFLDNNVYVSGNFTVLGSSTEVHISSSVIELDDNIIRLNAYSPFERYAGFEVIDSGSNNTSASLVWDSLNDYWMFVSASGQSSKLLGTTAGAYGSETNLTSGTFPIATGQNTVGDSLLKYSGTTLSFNTNKFTIDSSNGDTMIDGNVTLNYSGGTDNGTLSSTVVFRNSSNVLGYVGSTDTQNETTGLLGYDTATGVLEFSSLIDGGTY